MSENKIKPNDPVQFKWSGTKNGNGTVTMHRVLAEKMEKQGKGEIVKAKSPSAESPEKKAGK